MYYLVRWYVTILSYVLRPWPSSATKKRRGWRDEETFLAGIWRYKDYDHMQALIGIGDR